MSNNLVQFLIQELTTKLPPDRAGYVRGNGFWLRCPNPQHSGGQERTPSFTVNLDPNAKAPLGYCGCFGCKTKMPWNDFAKLFNLTRISEGAVAEAMAGEIFQPPRRDVDYLPDMDKMVNWPVNVPWRGIDGSTVRKLDGRIMRYRGGFSLFFPVLMYGEPVGGVTALTERPEGHNQLAYFNTPGEWSHNALFGYDLAAEKSGPLITCEGPRDAAALIEAGGRAVSFLGSAVTKGKLNLITELDPPIVISAFDNDDAGNAAHRRIMDTLGRVMPVVRFVMEPGEDPAGMPRSVLKERVKRSRLYKSTENLSDSKDFTGKKIDRLRVLGYIGGRKQEWDCLCECGKFTIRQGQYLKAKKSGVRSCGCVTNVGKKNITHGLGKHPLYGTWRLMHKRCYDKSCPDYPGYGGKGIRVCKRWAKPAALGLKNFIEDMGPKKQGQSLDRKDYTKGYSPSNCRWASARTQGNNSSWNVKFEFGGLNLTIAQWARAASISPDRIKDRRNKLGWTDNGVVLFAPLGFSYKKRHNKSKIALSVVEKYVQGLHRAIRKAKPKNMKALRRVISAQDRPW